MKILLTGAFGFVAGNISKAIKQNTDASLVAVDIFKIDNTIYDEFFYWKDLDKIDWKTIDTVIHLAGKAHDTKNTSDEKSYFDINVGLTKEIFQYFIESNAKQFIFFSSVKAVADKVDGDVLNEEVKPNPQTPYGKSKLAAEQHILKYNGNKKVYILRPCMIHGPGNKGNLNLLYNVVKRQIPWPLGAFKNQRSLCSIDNLAFVLSQIIQKDIQPGIYQIADDQPVSTNRIIELISESLGKWPKIWKTNRKLVFSIARLGDFAHLPLNTERLKKLSESYVVSNTKLKSALNINKLPVNAEEGLIKTLDSFKN